MITAAGADARAQIGAPAAGGSADEMIDGVQSNEAEEGQVDGDNVVKKYQYEQKQKADNERNEQRDMGNGDGHEDLLGSGRWTTKRGEGSENHPSMREKSATASVATRI